MVNKWPYKLILKLFLLGTSACSVAPNNEDRFRALLNPTPEVTATPTASPSPEPSSSPEPTGPFATFVLAGGFTSTESTANLNGRVYSVSTRNLSSYTSLDNLVIPHASTEFVRNGSSLILAGGLSFSGFSSSVQASTGIGTGWSQVAALPAGRQSAFTISFSGSYYLIGGANGIAPQNTVMKSSDGVTWAFHSTLPAARSHGAAIVLGGTLFYLGGQSGLAIGSAEQTIFSTTDGTAWGTHSGTLPLGITNARVVSDGTLVYLIGGQTTTSNLAQVYSSSDLITWTAISTLPEARYRAGGAAFSGSLYVFGGFNDSGNATRTVWKNTPTSSAAWTEVGTLPETLAGMALIQTE